MKRTKWGLAAIAWRLGVLIPAILAACFSFSSMAKVKAYKPWLEKDWTQWTEDDCGSVLGGSPWSQTRDSSTYSLNTIGSSRYGSQVQLRSALPMRQAILRLQQLDRRYDKMNTDKRQSFDQAHPHDWDQFDQVKIYVRNNSVESPPDSDSVQPDYVAGPERARQVALRLPNGTIVVPIQTNKVKYSPDTIDDFQNQFEYVFPRTVNGKPLYASSDSIFVIELGAPLVFDRKTQKVRQQDFRDSGKRYTFKVSNLMYKGKLEY